MQLSRSTQLIILFVAGLGALVTGVQLARTVDDDAGHNAAHTSTAVPAKFAPLTLPDASGVSVSSNDWSGKTLLVNFWASWCAPCREEIPVFARIGKRYEERGLKVIGIALDDIETARRVGDEIGLDYLSLVAERDAGYSLLEQYNAGGALPFSLLVSPQGDIVDHKLGIWHLQPLTEAIEAALTKP